MKSSYHINRKTDGVDMKNQYFADIGDYSKFALISTMLPTGLKIGLNWYLTQNDEKTDGKYIEYLDKPEYHESDPELCAFLKQTINHNLRDVSEIKKFKRFSNVIFYEELLDIQNISARTVEGRNERIKNREDWFSKSLMQLSDRDLVFCDPDNGIATNKMKTAIKNSIKYITLSEIERMIDAGFSLVIYNHRDRSKEENYLEKIRNSYCGTHAIKTRVIRFHRYSVRDYVFLIQQRHQQVIESSIDKILSDKNWNKHFKEINLKIK